MVYPTAELLKKMTCGTIAKRFHERRPANANQALLGELPEITGRIRYPGSSRLPPVVDLCLSAASSCRPSARRPLLASVLRPEKTATHASEQRWMVCSAFEALKAMAFGRSVRVRGEPRTHTGVVRLLGGKCHQSAALAKRSNNRMSLHHLELLQTTARQWEQVQPGHRTEIVGCGRSRVGRTFRAASGGRSSLPVQRRVRQEPVLIHAAECGGMDSHLPPVQGERAKARAVSMPSLSLRNPTINSSAKARTQGKGGTLNQWRGLFQFRVQRLTKMRKIKRGSNETGRSGDDNRKTEGAR